MTDIVERLIEKIIVDAFVSGSISDGALCDRLIRERLDAADEIERLRAENETLRRDVRTAVMGDSAELQDVKRENEKLLEALSEAEGHLEYAYIITFRDRLRDAAIAARSALAAIREKE